MALPVRAEEPVERGNCPPPADSVGREVAVSVPPAPTIVPVPTQEVEGVGDMEAGTTVAEGGCDTEFPGL